MIFAEETMSELCQFLSSSRQGVMNWMTTTLSESLCGTTVTKPINFLSCMPGLTKVLLQDVHLTGESDVNSVTLSESLKEFEMYGGLPDRVCNISVAQLVSFLSCMPGLTKVLLQDVHLTGESDVNSVTLSESLKEFKMSCFPDRVFCVAQTTSLGVDL